MVIPVGILVLVVALIFAFSYYGAGDWYIGAAVIVVGVILVVLMFFISEAQDRKHHRPPMVLKFDKRLFLLGALVSMVGMILVLVAGGVLSGFVSTVAVLMGVALLVGGVFMFLISLRG